MCSPFTPRARKTALDRLPHHLGSLSFDTEDGEGEDVEEMMSMTTLESQQQQAPLTLNKTRTVLPLPAASPTTQQALSPRAWSPSFRPSTPVGKGFHLDPQDLTFGDRLAEGAYGVVWLARMRRPHRPSVGEKEEEVAVKVQRVPRDEQEQANLLIELSILHGLVHPRLIRYYGAALLSEEEAMGKEEWRPLLEGPKNPFGEAREE
eukprot:evm.model.NODE_12359_length_8708_cov_30.316950.3